MERESGSPEPTPERPKEIPSDELGSRDKPYKPIVGDLIVPTLDNIHFLSQHWPGRPVHFEWQTHRYSLTDKLDCDVESTGDPDKDKELLDDMRGNIERYKEQLENPESRPEKPASPQRGGRLRRWIKGMKDFIE